MFSFSGCFYSTTVGGLRSYENPKNKITAVPATEEEIWGAKFMVSDVLIAYRPNKTVQIKNLIRTWCDDLKERQPDL